MKQLQHNVYPPSRALLDELDILVDGLFKEKLVAPLLWRGSMNQVIHFLTDRYRKEDFIDTTEVEVIYDEKTGKFRITGGLSYNTLEELQESLGISLSEDKS